MNTPIHMKSILLKNVAAVVAVIMFLELFVPLASYALTSGPTQPEFSSFEPVATTNMVNEFSGAFTYNLPVIQIPGANGGGYALSLSYHGGASPDEEASWVGYGWTLNPGSITRNTRGFPDDYYGANIKYYNKTKKNWTITAGTMLGVEAFSGDFLSGGISGFYQLRLNSFRGYGYVAGYNANTMGLASFGYSVDNGRGSYNWSINPAGFLVKMATKFAAKGTEYAEGDELKAFADKMGDKLAGKAGASYDQMFNFYALHSYQDSRRAVNTTKYTGSSFNVTAGIQYTGIPFIGLQGQLTGNYTEQTNQETDNLSAWGYMYSGFATSPEAMMDYYVEKETPYTMRDKFLSIPFSNADNFVLTGEGLSGGFRMHNAKPGHFRPNAKTSNLEITQVGAEGSIGTTSGAGADYGTGSQTLDIAEWNAYNTRYKFASTATASYDEEIDEPYFFRFNNDMGGKVTFEHTTSTPEDQARSGFNIVPEINPVANAGHRSGRSSFIAYHTNQEINDGYGYTKDAKVNNLVMRSHSLIAKGLGEVAVYNEQGNRYVYGLPVYSMQEQTLQYGNRVEATDPVLIPDDEKYRAKYGGSVTNPDNAKYVVGEQRDNPYAASFLLTEITTSDYVDLSNDGPSTDDLGGYVRFVYDRAYGSYSKTTGYAGAWYKWRTPYSGMLYQRNELSEPDDNTGSVLNGSKEIYYLDTIETKTHYAVFEKSERLDGLSAQNESSALTSLTAKGSKTLQKLDRIKLYAKGADGKPSSDDKLLSTTHFDYDYALCQGLPNSNGAGNKTGKLTLRKVWFEYEGVVNTRITPYVFGYEYRTSGFYSNYLSSDLMNKYTDIVHFSDALSSPLQNPDYNPCNIDAWGSYQAGGMEKYRRMQGWVNQNPPNFDPAAWQLKWIRLPSGGEIHVQYEQHDYNYVQDRRAMAMVKTHKIGNTPDGNKFYLDIDSSLGTAANPAKIAALIKEQFVNTQEEMYFKLLYSLYDPGTEPTLENAEIQYEQKLGAEYITGYSRVTDAGVEGGKVYVVFENKPRQVGLDLVETQKAGREERMNPYDDNSAFGAVIDFISNFGRTFFDEDESCMRVNWSESYIRIPIQQPKKGGGIRVKRLFVFDPGLDGSGSGAIYGSEYDYSIIDEHTGERISSGVATNEPGSMREENALVISLKKRFDQTGYQRATAGDDKDQFEGPIGESILPSASVGYSRVVVKNIHDGITGNGFIVHEFYTAKDYPFDKYYEHLASNGTDWTPLALNKSRSQVSLIISNKTTENIEAQQGYRFVVNAMHGQSKRVSTYAGSYNDESTWILSVMQEFTYYEPGEKVPVFEGPNKPLRYDTPGKEMEVVFESKKIHDKTNNFTLEVDVSFLGLLFPIPTAFPSWVKNESVLKTHITTKVIHYPAIQKSTINYKDGIYHLTENIAFHPATGKPLMTRTTDGHDKLSLAGQGVHNGTYHTYNFPAEQDYSNMGQKSANERMIVYSSTTTHTISKSGLTLLFSNGSPEFINHTLTQKLFTGDLIELSYVAGSKEQFYVGSINSNSINLENVYPATSSVNGAVRTIQVIRSGRTNNLMAMAGNIITYGENKQAMYDYANELERRQRIVNQLNNDLLRGESSRMYNWNTYQVPFRMNKIHPDSANVFRQLDPEYAIGMELKNNKTVIEFSPRRVVCGDSATPHPLVGALNNALNQLWASTITTASANYLCGTLNTTEYKYPTTDPNMQWMQSQVIQPVINLLRAQTNQCMPWPWESAFQQMTVTMLPSFPAGHYNRSTITGLKNGIGQRQLASLGIMYGDRYLLRCYVTTGATCQYTWGFLPDIQENLEPGESFAHYAGTGQPFATLMGAGTFTANIGRFGQTNKGILFFECLLTNKKHYYKMRFEKNVLDATLPPTGGGLVTTIQKSPTGPGYFALSDDGQIVYYKSGSSTPIDIECIDFPSIPARKNAGPDITKVVSASAQTYDDNWSYDNTSYGVPVGMGNYQSGKRGKWRPKSNFSYKTSISDAVSGGVTDRSYNAGIYSDFALFDRSAPTSNGWLQMNTVTKYSPYGEALEEQNILNISSTAKFGYANSMPVLVAQNAENTAVTFISFEDKVGSGITNSYAHSGKSSYNLSAGNSYATDALTLNTKLKEQGLLVKFWVRTANFQAVDPTFVVQIDRGGSLSSFPTLSQVARTGEWALYQAIYPAAALSAISDGNFTVKLKAGSTDVYIDDIRVQPLDSQMMTYVYDATTLRVTAIMDDQHFGLYYQYNAEGKLVRKLKETERGIKTIAETQYHTPMVERNQVFASLVAPVSPSTMPNIFDGHAPRNSNLLEQLLDGNGTGGGGTFQYNKTLTVPDGQMQMLQQQVDSVNRAGRQLSPRSVQPKNSKTSNNKD
jgi:hypothetical protein